MWSLIRADIDDQRIGLGVIGLCVVALFLIHSAGSGWDFNAFVHGTTTSALIGVGFIVAGLDKQKRGRAHAILPMPVVSVAIARVGYVLVVFVALIPVWTVFLLVRPQTGSIADLWMMFSSLALAMISYFVFVIHQDLGKFGTSRYRARLYVVLALLLATLAVLGSLRVLDTWGDRYGDFLSTLQGAAFHMILAALLFGLSVRVFVRRRSYLS